MCSHPTLSSSSGIKILDIGLTNVSEGHRKDLSSSDVGWSTLDQFLTSETFVSLRKIVQRMRLEMRGLTSFLDFGPAGLRK